MQVHRLEYAKVLLRDDKIGVEVRDGTRIVQRSAEYFPTEQLADKWIAEQKASKRLEERLAVGDK